MQYSICNILDRIMMVGDVLQKLKDERVTDNQDFTVQKKLCVYIFNIFIVYRYKNNLICENWYWIFKNFVQVKVNNVYKNKK